jgi:hypothetical protein
MLPGSAPVMPLPLTLADRFGRRRMLVVALLGARAVVSGLGGDEMVAVGSAESEQTAVDKTENFDLPWRGPAARAALPCGDDQIAPPAVAGGVTLAAAECVAPPLLRVGLWPVHPFAEAPLIGLGDQLPFRQPRQRAYHGPVRGRPRCARPRHLHPQALDEVPGHGCR